LLFRTRRAARKTNAISITLLRKMGPRPPAKWDLVLTVEKPRLMQQALLARVNLQRD